MSKHFARLPDERTAQNPAGRHWQMMSTDS